MNLFNRESISSFFGLDSQTQDDDYGDKSYGEETKLPKNSQVLNEQAIYETEIDSTPTHFSQPNQTLEKATDVSPVSEPINKKKVVPINDFQNTAERNRKIENKREPKKVKVFEPSNYIECRTIAKALFDNEVAIITFSSMEELQARRVVDFLTGTVFAIDGDIQRIGSEIFLCTPANVEVTSAIAQSLVATHLGEY
ncbi:hypothetical protein CBF34_02110 [Vagococcus penaei]|uniref:Cell division protein SepF n=1 Tax=Vagococcus penaei TaxID=633807 RepID=A0A1Q2D7M2_9ENTE|nr:cell division protein SepF [Vagococcus penaei]AQP54426.1 hypothetical protein BW732_09425 [Vagococcus penaei]RSU06343.1 hypothetical protein CBF34_02110 [Vagococcus penaei]